jgi:thiol-disulfide isomerase/thioredoxin
MPNNEYASTAHRKNWALLAGIFLLVALLLIFRSSLGPDVTLPEGTEHPAVGQELPLLALEPLSGADRAATLEDLAGQVVLINYWGTWCPPCRLELPLLVALAERFRGEPRFRFLPVSCGPGEGDDLTSLRRDTEAFLNQSHLDIPVYADADFSNRAALDRIGGFSGYPTTLLIDSRHVIRAVWAGYHPEVGRQIETTLKRLLKEDR